MKITRFDEIELNVLICASPDRMGYYSRGEEAKRAKLLMNDGILKFSPQENWQMNGWNLTEYGKKYYKAFLNKLRKFHGHVWIKSPYKSKDTIDNVDTFAYTRGDYHNGPRCINCGFGFCHHCTSEMSIQECPNKQK